MHDTGIADGASLRRRLLVFADVDASSLTKKLAQQHSRQRNRILTILEACRVQVEPRPQDEVAPALLHAYIG